MNYLRAYTPRIRPLEYDSLRSEVGCLEISGSKNNELLPFSTECVFSVKPDTTYDQLKTVSEFLGPANHLIPDHPYTTIWSAWVATETIRVGQFSNITPPSNSLGEESRLFAGTVTTQLSGAFNRDGLLAIAIQKSEGIIQIRRYTDNLGTVANIEFSGDFPSLIYLGLVFVSELPEQSEIVCYYLRKEKPGIIYARLESEGFAMERQVNNDIRAKPTEWLYATTDGRMIVLRGRDGRDRYLLYKTKEFSLTSTDTIGLGATITGGEYFLAGIDVPTPAEDNLGVDVTITSGSYSLAIVEPSALSAQNIAVNVTITSGEYNLADS